MPTSVRIFVMQGNCTELLPTMCMFCGEELEEENFQQVPMQIGDGPARPVPLPICRKDRLPMKTLQPDGRGQNMAAIGLAFGAIGVLVAQNLQRHQESVHSSFTFDDVHSRFARELDRLRNLTPKEYDKLMAEANKAFLAKIAGTAPVETEEERAEREKKEAEDAAMFGMDDVKTTGEASVEVTRSNSRKLLWVGLAVGAITVALVACVSVSVVAYLVMSAKPEPTKEEIAKKKDLTPPKEMKAKIKNIDRTVSTIRFLVGDGKYQTLNVESGTEFLDEGGNRLPRGFDAPELREEDFVVILPTADRKGLQWVKLAK